jgi:hypothetical protein
MQDACEIVDVGLSAGGGNAHGRSTPGSEVMYRWTERLRERVASLLGRVTGVSTPFVGVTWRPLEAPPRRVTADVRVRLVGPARHARFVIVNAGEGTAHGVQFDIKPEDGQESPLVKGDYDQKLPIEILRPGDSVELLAGLTFGSGTVFGAKWRWRDEDGELRERTEKVALQSHFL